MLVVHIIVIPAIIIIFVDVEFVNLLVPINKKNKITKLYYFKKKQNITYSITLDRYLLKKVIIYNLYIWLIIIQKNKN